MKAAPRTLKKLFEGGRQFRIPVYQRPYVWTRERQWEPLWNDLAATARQYARSLHSAGSDPRHRAEAEKQARPHFLGAIVVEPIHTVVGGLERRSVVDGQQRLTTLQLLIRGVLDAVTNLHDARTLKAKLRKLVRNDPDEYSDRDLLKVTPRRSDDKAYATAIRTETADLAALGEEHADTLRLSRRFNTASAKSSTSSPRAGRSIGAWVWNLTSTPGSCVSRSALRMSTALGI